MRVFLGTSIPPTISTELAGRLTTVLEQPDWRIAPLEQWHVTALFLGERPFEALPIIEQAAAKQAGNFGPITLKAGRLVTMPKLEPTMLWIRFRPNEELTALHLALAAATGSEPSIYRPYWPHITLARKAQRLVDVIDGDIVIPELVLGELTLFRSSPSSKGSIHDPVGSWRFTGKGRAAPVEEG